MNISDLKNQINALKDRKNEILSEINIVENNIIEIVERLPRIFIIKLLLLKRNKIKDLKKLKYSLKQKQNEIKHIKDAIGDIQNKIRDEITQTVYMTVGIIGSGKSTWTKNKVKENEEIGKNTVIVNKDKIREMIYGKYEYVAEKEELIRNIAWDCLRRGLEFGNDVIVDETNITIDKRKQWIDYIRMIFGYNIKIIYVYCSERERNLRFRKQSGFRDISEERWENLINFMIKDFQPIGKEGQNEVIEYKIPKFEL